MHDKSICSPPPIEKLRYNRWKTPYRHRIQEQVVVFRVSGQLPQRKIAPPPSSQIIIHWKIAHPRVDDYSQKVSPEENYPLDNGLCGKLPPGWLHPDYWSQTNIPKIIAPWQYPLGNCPRAKLSFRWFVFYRIASRTNGPKENCPLGKHSQG